MSQGSQGVEREEIAGTGGGGVGEGSGLRGGHWIAPIAARMKVAATSELIAFP